MDTHSHALTPKLASYLSLAPNIMWAIKFIFGARERVAWIQGYTSAICESALLPLALCFSRTVHGDCMYYGINYVV